MTRYPLHFLVLLLIGCSGPPARKTDTSPEAIVKTASHAQPDTAEEPVSESMWAALDDVAVSGDADDPPQRVDTDTYTPQPLPPIVEVDCTGVRAGSKTARYSKTKPQGLKNQRAAARFNHYLNECPEIAVEYAEYDDYMALYFRHKNGVVDLVQYEHGNGVDGMDFTAMTRIILKRCDWYEITQESSFQSVAGPVWFGSSLGSHADARVFDSMALQMAFGWGYRYAKYQQCDPAFGSQVIKASRFRDGIDFEFHAIDDVYVLFLSTSQLPHRIRYFGKPLGGPAAYFSREDLLRIPGVFSETAARDTDRDDAEIGSEERNACGDDEKCPSPQAGALVGDTKNPVVVYQTASWRVYQAPVRIRQGGVMVAVYNKTTNEHVWAGLLTGAVKWQFAHEGLLFGETKANHPAFEEDNGFVILNLQTGGLHRLNMILKDNAPEPPTCQLPVDENGDERESYELPFPDRNWSIKDNVLTTERQDGCEHPIKIDWTRLMEIMSQ